MEKKCSKCAISLSQQNTMWMLYNRNMMQVHMVYFCMCHALHGNMYWHRIGVRLL